MFADPIFKESVLDTVIRLVLGFCGPSVIAYFREVAGKDIGIAVRADHFLTAAFPYRI